MEINYQEVFRNVFSTKDEWGEGDRIQYGGAVIGFEEIDAVLKTIIEGKGRNWTIGKKGEEFERILAEYAKHPFVTLTNSGSSAILLALQSANLPSGSLVAFPATTFPTVMNSIIQSGYKPFVIDADVRTFNLSVDDLAFAFKHYGKQIAAVIVVAIAGNIPNLEAIKKLCDTHKTILILDNCDGFGGMYKGFPAESWAQIACTSFHAAHIISMGEGGAVFTSDPVIAERVRSLRDWGREGASDEGTKFHKYGLPEGYPQRYSYTMIGYNLKPLELQAAMGIVQFGKMEKFKEERKKNFMFLKSVFEKYPSKFRVVETIEGADPCWFSFPIFVLGGWNKRRFFATYLESKNIETRPIFAGNILRHPAYELVKVKRNENLTGANNILSGAMFIGISPRNPQKAYDYVAKCVDEYSAI